MWSTLERLLATERFPRRSTAAGFARPTLFERAAPEGGAPFVASNARRGFVSVRASAAGHVRSGFSEVELGADEELFLAELFRALWALSVQQGWTNRCTSIREAIARMGSFGLVPRLLAVPLDLLREACGREVTLEEAEKLMLSQGYIAEVDELQVLLAPQLAPTTAVLTTLPNLVGAYTRVDEWLSVLLCRADRALVLVDDGSVA